MKVILQADVKGHGKRGDYVEVSDGYARNYLIPRGIALEASNANLNILKGKRESQLHREERELEDAQKIAEKLGGITLVIKAKAGDNGKLFGSVTTKEIAEMLKSKHKIEIDKRKLVLTEGLKSIGEHELEVKLHPQVHTKLKILLEKEHI